MTGEATARESATVVRNNFGAIDGDGSNILSRDELDRFATDPRRSEIERNAAADVLAHFDLVKEMATASYPSSLPNDVAIGHYASNAKFIDSTRSNAITKRDIDAMLVDYSDEGIDGHISELRSAEIKDGAAKVGVGVVLTAIGGVGTVGMALEFPPAALLTGGIALGGLALTYSGARDLWGRASDPLRAEYEQRKDVLQSW